MHKPKKERKKRIENQKIYVEDCLVQFAVDHLPGKVLTYERRCRTLLDSTHKAHIETSLSVLTTYTMRKLECAWTIGNQYLTNQYYSQTTGLLLVYSGIHTFLPG